MKRIVLLLLCILLAVPFSGCARKAAVKNTIEGNMNTYFEMTDGTWMCDDQLYQYRLEITGRIIVAVCAFAATYIPLIVKMIRVAREGK